MRKICWNEGWIVTETGLTDDPFAGAGAGKAVMLPHDVMIEKSREADLPGGAAQGYFPDGDYRYEKSFALENTGGGYRYLVEFEGTYNNSQVFVNGNAAVGCRYGYTDYFVDITDYVTAGKNSIAIELKPGIGRNTRWYTGNGILRNVYLHEGGSAGFIPGELKISTMDIMADGQTAIAVLGISGKVYGTEDCQAAELDYVIVHSGTGETVASGTICVETDACFADEVRIEDADLWTAETPELYEITVQLLIGTEDNMTAVDADHARFGIRTIATRAGEGLLVNGKQVKLRGGCIHAENGITGAAEYEALAFRKIRTLKYAGFNAVRMAHHPASAAILDACDKIGMYVMDESFDTWHVSKTQYDYTMWFDENWRTDLDSLVRKDFNHPSVIMYTIGNEIKELDTLQGIRQNKLMAEYMKELDPTRPVSNSINGMFTAMAHMPEIMGDIIGASCNDSEAADKETEGASGDINQVMTFLDSNMDDIMRHRYVTEMLEPICEDLDIAGYNYMGGRYETDAVRFPDRIIVGSETRPDTIAANWDRVQRLPNVIGDFVWTAWDYIGEAGIGRIDHDELDGPMYARYPWMLSCTGDIDILGYRRPQSYYREIVWGLRSDPYIAIGRMPEYGTPARTSNWSWSEVVRSWTWPGLEGHKAHVEVYSDAEEIELLLDGKSIGRKPVGTEMPFAAVFELPYSAGELVAIAYTGGRQSGRDVLSTAGADRMIHVDTTMGGLADDAYELVMVDILIGDRERNTDVREYPSVSVTIEGPAEMIGCGSADPKTTESYQDLMHAAYEGRLRAIFRRKKSDAGSTKVIFSCPEESLIEDVFTEI